MFISSSRKSLITLNIPHIFRCAYATGNSFSVVFTLVRQLSGVVY